MATYQEICDKILLEAQRGGKAAEMSNLNSQSVIEAMMPSILQDVALACYRNPNKRPLLKRTHTIVITNGVGVLPPTALKEALPGGMVLEPDDPDVLPEDISYVPEFVDFVAAKGYDPRLGYFCVRDDEDFYYTSPAENTYGTFTGNLEYIGHTVPQIPAAATDTVDWPDEIVSDVVDYGSEMLRGMEIAV